MITGSPQAAASRAARPRPSGFRPASLVRTGRANTVACCSSLITAARGMAPGQGDGVAQPQPVDHRLQPGPLRTVTDQDQLQRRIAGPAPVQDQPPGPQQAGKPLLRNESANGHAARPTMIDSTRPELAHVDRRRQPQHPFAARRAQRAGDPPLGVAGDGRQVIAPVADPAQQPACAGHRGPPCLVAVREPDDPLRSGAAERGGQQAEWCGGAEDHPGRAEPIKKLDRSAGGARRRQQQRSGPHHREASLMIRFGGPGWA